MVKIKDLVLVMVVGALLFGVGVWVGRSDTSIVHAQSGDHHRYQLAHGAYTENDKAFFYAIRLDRQTGDSQVLTVERHASDDEWLVLPVKDKR